MRFMKRKNACALLTTALFALNSAGAGAVGVTTISVSLEQTIDAPRWMYDSKAKVKGGALISQMVEAKRALMAKDRGKCLAALQKSYALGKSLGPWLAWNQLQCAILRDKDGKASVTALEAAVNKVDAEPRWLLFGPSANLLRLAYTSALLTLVEQQVKSDRRLAWATVDKLQQVRSWLSVDERANIYHYAGELAFIEQNLGAAQDFLLRSLNERESTELRAKVESIRTALIGRSVEGTTAPATSGAPPASGKAAGSSGTAPTSTKTPVPGPVAATPGNDDLGITDEERDIFGRMNRAYQSQDYISAIEDGVELIQKFPGSRRSTDAADRVLDIYVSLSNKTDEKYRNVRETAVKEMEKADAGRMSRWAANAYAKGNYLDALSLAEKAYRKYDGHPDSTKVLLLAAKSAVASGEYEDAKTNFTLLLNKHGGTVEAAEASFRLGLLEYRLKHYAPSAAYFERLLALSQGKDFEYRALYWQWRAQQKLDRAKSASYAAPLLAKYPMTYYGLRARAELDGGTMDLPNEPTSAKAELRLLETERLAWERFTVLLRAGWFREAERELESLPEPQSNDERLIRAKYWAATLRYDNAIILMNKAFEENPALLQVSLLRMVFPKEYLNFVTHASKASGVGPEWLLSIMRQESSFRPEIKSPSNAYGVMQLVNGTAAEIAKDLKVKDFSNEQLNDPEMSLKLGSVYFSRLERSFNSNVALALAAYNAGPTRVRRWLNARKDLSPLEAAPSSAPESEVWIDELPWEETSHYVKAVLRNWLIYKILDGSKLTLSEPIWVDGKTPAR